MQASSARYLFSFDELSALIDELYLKFRGNLIQKDSSDVYAAYQIDREIEKDKQVVRCVRDYRSSTFKEDEFYEGMDYLHDEMEDRNTHLARMSYMMMILLDRIKEKEIENKNKHYKI